MSIAEKPRVSVIVCTHNRAPLAATCVESLLQQSLDPGQVEILIIDSASTDHTLERLQGYEGKGNTRVLHEAEPGLSKARNRGLNEAAAPLVAFIDDDAVASREWLEHITRAFETPGVVAAGGPVELNYETPPPRWLTGALLEPLGFRDHGCDPLDMTGKINLLGANCAFLKAPVHSLNGFNENLGRIGNCLLSGEETELQRKLEAAGGRIRYAPKALVYHHVPTARMDPRWFMKRYYWGGISDAYMPSFRRRGAQGAPPQEVVGRPSQFLFVRMLLNAYDALPWQPAERKIPARIYFAYAAGYLAGKVMRPFRERRG